jgi:hypothetical protein
MAKFTPETKELFAIPFSKRIDALSEDYAVFALAVQVTRLA